MDDTVLTHRASSLERIAVPKNPGLFFTPRARILFAKAQ